GEAHVVLGDFDLMNFNIQPGHMFGTQGFLSPEMVRGHRPQSITNDLFSLGCSLYWMLFHRTPIRDFMEIRREPLILHLALSLVGDIQDNRVHRAAFYSTIATQLRSLHEQGNPELNHAAQEVENLILRLLDHQPEARWPKPPSPAHTSG